MDVQCARDSIGDKQCHLSGTAAAHLSLQLKCQAAPARSSINHTRQDATTEQDAADNGGDAVQRRRDTFWQFWSE